MSQGLLITDMIMVEFSQGQRRLEGGSLMSEAKAVFEAGEKVHIIERRRFAEGLRRHFIGEIVRCAENAIRVRGRVWVFDTVNGGFVRKPELRERIICLDGWLTINGLPKEAILEEAKYVELPQRGLVITDGKNFSLDLTEFTATR